MLKTILSITIAIVIFRAGIVLADDSGPLSFRLGTGYEFVSQEYFLETTSLDPDSSLNAALLTREYLDDKKGFLYIQYAPDSAQMQKFEAGWEQTQDLFRGVFRADLSHNSGPNRFDFDLDFDIKRNTDGTADIGEESSVARGQLKYRYKLNERFEPVFRIYGENVDFVQSDAYVYDYRRIGGEAGFGYLSKGFNSLYFSILTEKRSVPDSSDLDYNLTRGYVGYYGLLGKNNLSAEFSLEKKDYNRDENLGDYWLTIGSVDLKIPLNFSHFLRPNVEIESFNFNANDYFSDDYFLFRGGLLWEYERNMATFSAGPKIEIANISSNLDADDDYFESFLQLGYDRFDLSGLFILVENQAGFREYIHNPEYNSDFYFDRFSIIGSAPIYKKLTADLLFSAEWEWHKIDSDDSRLYLVSASLSYKF